MSQHEVMPFSTTGPGSHRAISTCTRRSSTGFGFRHEALFYAGGDDGFLEGTLELVTAAVEDDGAVLVAVAPKRAEALRQALGDYARWVEFADMRSAGRNPARIISMWDEFVKEHGGGRPLGLAEPVWPGRSEAELGECERHEALLNIAFDGGPAWHLLCPYDLDALDDNVIETAQCNHPILARDRRSRTSETYRGRREPPLPFSGDLPAPSAPFEELAFTRAELAELRRHLGEWAAQESLGVEESEELILAVNELTTNSIRHGGGCGVLRLWREDGALLCEVQDGGQIGAPLAGRLRPDGAAQSGRGLWIANQLCDLVQIRSARGGTVVRVHKEL